MTEHVPAERPWLTKAKRKRLRYYRSSKAYLVKSANGGGSVAHECILPSQVRQNVTVAHEAPGSSVTSYPEGACTLELAERATRGEASHEARAARRAREAGSKLSK